MRRLLDREVRRGLFLLWCAGWVVIVVLSLQPQPELPAGLSDKLLHFIAYAVMAAMAAGFCHVPRRLAAWAVVTVALGGAVELAQGLLPWRSAELADLAADAGGAGAGWLLGLLWLTLLIRPLARDRQPA
jgi:VanZ family protein